METIVSKLGIQPDEKLTDRIRYNKQHAIYEGITGERISYVAPGNKLASGTFVRFKNPKSAYDSLFRIFTARHGKPIKNSEGVPVWRTPGTDIVLSLSKDLMMASAAPKLPK
ncbi:hypothetical protein [Spirosoma panaciterrae]|uniref:hypothetical protein n=1 Tax=Spirosoma panaciterrae TaxID=496058 RepID=UPI0012FB4543|nr:hypothetical protein [Spirosoma panaciterrae]